MPVETAIDGWSCNREEFGEIADGTFARGMHAAESRCCRWDGLGCLPRSFPLGAGDGHAFAGGQAYEVGFELGEGGEDIEERLAHGIAGIVERRAQGQFHVPFPKLVGYGDGLTESGAGAGGTGEAIIGVDPILGVAEPPGAPGAGRPDPAGR